MKKLLIPVVLIFVIAGYLVWQYRHELTEGNKIPASGTIETTEVTVGSHVGGRIENVLTAEGLTVANGQTLIVFEPYQLPAQKTQLEGQLAQAEARLQEMLNGARPQEIAQARALYQSAQAQANETKAGFRKEEIAQASANTKQAQADYVNAEANYKRFQTLLQRHVISQQEFDSAKANYGVALERLNANKQRELELKNGNRPEDIAAAQAQARAQYEQLRLLQAGTRSEQISAQRATIEGIRGQLDAWAASAKELSVKAPCQCEVSSMNLKPGQLILPDQTLATLIDLNDLWVRVYIPEERFGRVKLGDTASVKVDAFPNKTFTGKVIQLASRAEFTPRNVQTPETRKLQVFGIKLQLDNRERLLRPGMPADVVFALK